MTRFHPQTAALIAALGLASPAMAQDRQPNDWSGRYVGLSLGTAFLSDDSVRLRPSGDTPGKLELNGTQAGVQIGWNRQFGDLVWGIEADLQAGRVRDSLRNADLRGESHVDRSASLRLRLGYAMGNGLIYGMSGLTLGALDYRVTGTDSAGAPVAIDHSGNDWGYTYGLGYEQALAGGDWTLRGEISYQNFGRTTVSDGVNSTEATPEFHSLRLGLNRRF
ncbi:hypothetical protein CCR83_15015 [Rhodobacter veldkampii DSM 11550]|uniref:Outer membrane protein beta-barrel domain-containing protein n=1 Tax=Phaeovulum veldkampii DSM 11550 TaxID=1185920 RepID=A0A2T4JHQ2_9RHOB|nr:outer membrane beta-barrel protein [Phaeovulum veldkampii]MBK5947723.1 hypothetical protein [Phaeovulum veldkampii DSM 11550]NCU20605.1 porin family protein [Candidatus Falkowbacteria bacterium]PTE17441.1 hypothetical protein C5F46_09355 [Phaeovulum veldkampii DSM 11550]TDQ60342.1 outer membrane immunogenic protein [Phaeovulum veldkampii DSM 11550]